MSRPFEECKQCQLLHDDPRPKRNTKVFCLEQTDISVLDRIKHLHCNLGHIGEDKLLGVVGRHNIQHNNLKQAVHNTVSQCLQCA